MKGALHVGGSGKVHVFQVLEEFLTEKTPGGRLEAACSEPGMQCTRHGDQRRDHTHTCQAMYATTKLPLFLLVWRFTNLCRPCHHFSLYYPTPSPSTTF